MVICDKCELKQKETNGILEFPFKIFDSKQKMSKDLLKLIQNNPHYLLEINEKYNSNIIHELVYKLIRFTYFDKIYREQHIWALEILSDLPEYPYLTSHRNCKNELPIETYIRLAEDKTNLEYLYIRNLLLKNDLNNIKIVCQIPVSPTNEAGPAHDSFQAGEINQTNPASSEIKYNFIYENTSTNTYLDPRISMLTKQYHNLQKKLFGYFEENYRDCITKCEKCSATIDIFNDFEKIGQCAKKDKYKKLLIKNIEHIISLRNKGVSLAPVNVINERHRYIIGFFETLKSAINN